MYFFKGTAGRSSVISKGAPDPLQYCVLESTQHLPPPFHRQTCTMEQSFSGTCYGGEIKGFNPSVFWSLFFNFKLQFYMYFPLPLRSYLMLVPCPPTP